MSLTPEEKAFIYSLPKRLLDCPKERLELCRNCKDAVERLAIARGKKS